MISSTEKEIQIILDNIKKKNIDIIVIYPYGKNGKLVYEIIKNNWNKDKIIIIDNEKFKNDDKIISFEFFKEKSLPNFATIITVGDYNLYRDFFNQIKEYCISDNIYPFVVELQIYRYSYNINDFKLPRL